MLELNPLNHPICLALPRRLTPFSAWQEHVPFAMWLVDVLRPKIIVELGTQYGDSYCAFCQAVQELKLDTLCYAIDTWQGDPHTGFYGHEVLADLRAHHDPLYGSFSRLIQSTFDEALQDFADGTIDLLHIDGYHIYESVKHDFESWLPKISPRGVVLFHDINVCERDFEVRRFWDEAAGKYPHFEFLHCHGLGLLAIGKIPSKELKSLLEATDEGMGTIRNFFSQLGQQLTMEARDKVKASQITNLEASLQDKVSQITNLEASLQDKVSQITNLEASLQDKASQITNLEASLQVKASQITNLEASLQVKASQITNLEASLQDKASQITNLEASLQDKASQITNLEAQMQQIHRGIVMQLVSRYQRVVEKLLRSGTRRRYYYELGMTGIRAILNEGWCSSWFKFKQWRLLQGRTKSSILALKREPNAMPSKLCLIIRALPSALRQFEGIFGLSKKFLALAREVGLRQAIDRAVNYSALRALAAAPQVQKQGRISARATGETLFLTPSEFKPIGKARVALIIHAYYIDLFEEIYSYIKNMQVKHTLLISVKNKEDKEIIEKGIGRLPLVENAEIRVVDNRGRDIAPMLVDFAPMIKRFDYICHIHTKKSSYIVQSNEWRKYLYDSLLGSRERIQAILSVFAMNPSVGIIYPEEFYALPYWGHTWLGNKSIVSPILGRLCIRFDPDEYIDFPAGSMFWARREALMPLLELGLTHDDFPEERRQRDCTMQHAIERCFVIASQSRGLQYAVILDSKNHLFSYRSGYFQQYLATPFDLKLRSMLDAADVFSFDIFDTILTRPFASPDMVFKFLEEQASAEFGVEGFYEMRKEAENVARVRKQLPGDVRISEIYSVFAELAKISTETANKLLELEVDAETALLVPRNSVVTLAKEIKDCGKRVIFITDTYLERKHIEEILLAKGIDFFDELYISCEVGKRKDRGDLWEYVLKRESLTKNSIIHTGDNEESDVHVLHELSFVPPFYPIHVVKPSVLFRHSRLGEILYETFKPYNGWRENLLYGLVANAFCLDPSPKLFFESKEPLSEPFALGYTIFGPIIFDFISWLVKTSIEDHVGKLKFIAREGFILNQVFQSIVTHARIKDSGMILPQGDYFLCSRRAAIFAALRTKNDISPLLERHFNGTLKAFFDKRFYVSDMAAIEHRLGADALKQVVSLPRDYDKIYTYITRVYDILLKQAELEREALVQYCTEQEITGTDKIGLVDLGYSASIQKALNRILNHPLAGYYFVTDNMAETLRASGAICRACFGEFIEPFTTNISIYRYSLLMEAVLTAPTGQLVYFSRTPEGVLPHFKRPGVSQKEFLKIHGIHEGVLKFINDMLDLFGPAGLEIEFPKDMILDSYRMIITGELGIGDLKSALSVEDQYCGNEELPVVDWYSR